MAVACASSLAVAGAGAGGWEIGGPLGCLFTEAELAVADHLVQLSGGGDDSAGSESESPRSVNTCAAWEEEAVAVAPGLGLAASTMELDRRARKRYRLLSDVYAATRPVTTTGVGAGNDRKRKRGHETKPAIRYDGDRCF